MVSKYNYISAKELDLISIVDSSDDVIKILSDFYNEKSIRPNFWLLKVSFMRFFILLSIILSSIGLYSQEHEYSIKAEFDIVNKKIKIKPNLLFFNK